MTPRTRGGRRAPLGLIVGVAVATIFGCTDLSTAAGPSPCLSVHSAARCDAIARTAAGDVGVNPAEVTGVEILPEPTPEIVDGQVILHAYGGATPIRIGLTLADGSTRETAICGGIPSGSACTDDPHLRLSSTVDGYHDTPCTGEPPAGCATPVPTVDPAAAAAAVPITVNQSSVAVDHAGPYAVRLGTGSLPNGILSDAAFRLTDDWPDGLVLADESVRLEVRSLEPDGRPFRNVYEHGWRPGVERVEAVLVFDVKDFQPGATLEVHDLVVR